MAPARPYPRRTLEDALAVPLALKEKNGGNAWPPEDVAKALGMSKTNNRFFYLTASARDYGLPVGTRDAAEIAIAPLGMAIVYAMSPEEEYASKVLAFRSVEVFDRVLRW